MLQNYFTTIFTPVKGGGAKINHLNSGEVCSRINLNQLFDAAFCNANILTLMGGSSGLVVMGED